MLSILLNEHPELMQIIKDKLKAYVGYVEKMYNAPAGSYWYRFFKPDDTGIGGTAHQYYSTITDVTEENLLSLGAAITVPTANAYVIFGVYCDFDPNYQGYVHIKKQGVLKNEIPLRMVYEQDHPKYLYLDFDNILFAVEQENFDFVIYSAFGADQAGMCIPFMFRIASKAALNLEDAV